MGPCRERPRPSHPGLLKLHDQMPRCPDPRIPSLQHDANMIPRHLHARPAHPNLVKLHAPRAILLHEKAQAALKGGGSQVQQIPPACGQAGGAGAGAAALRLFG